MTQQFVLIINEPSVPSRRAVQVTGSPFTIGGAEEFGVRLRTPGAPGARIEAGDPWRLVTLDDARTESDLRHGDTFRLGDVSVRFFVGSAASLRRSLETSRETHEVAVLPDGAAKAVHYLARLEELEQKLAGMRLDLGPRASHALLSA